MSKIEQIRDEISRMEKRCERRRHLAEHAAGIAALNCLTGLRFGAMRGENPASWGGKIYSRDLPKVYS